MRLTSRCQAGEEPAGLAAKNAGFESESGRTKGIAGRGSSGTERRCDRSQNGIERNAQTPALKTHAVVPASATPCPACARNAERTSRNVHQCWPPPAQIMASSCASGCREPARSAPARRRGSRVETARKRAAGGRARAIAHEARRRVFCSAQKRYGITSVCISGRGRLGESARGGREPIVSAKSVLKSISHCTKVLSRVAVCTAGSERS